MGCDIHVHLEVKIGGEWLHLAAPHVRRNYDLFSVMAGVRNYNTTPISTPKGLPNDLTTLTRLDYQSWEGDSHNASWLGVDEIKELYRREKEFLRDGEYGLECVFKCYLFGNSYIGWKEYPEYNKMNIEDFRIVFWFDN